MIDIEGLTYIGSHGMELCKRRRLRVRAGGGSILAIDPPRSQLL